MKQSRFSPRLAKYLWSRFFLPLVCCLVSFVCLFLLIDCFDVLQDFLDSDTPFSMMLDFFAAKQPQRLTLVTPIAFLLSAMYAFAGLSRFNEITALKASGISLVRTSIYIWLTAIVGGLAMNYTMNNIIPGSSARADELEDRIGKPDLKIVKKRVLAYRSKENRRDWIFGQFSVEGEKRDVVVTQFRPDRTLEWEIRAEVAIHTGSDAGWLFEKGQIGYYDSQGELLVKKPEEFEAKRFPDLDEKPAHIRNSLSPVEELTTDDIYMILENNKGMPAFTIANCYTIIYHRMFFPVGCLIALLFAIPLSINSGRGGVFAKLGAALIMILSYYLVYFGFSIVAKSGYIDPLAAALIPTIGYLFGGSLLMYSKR